MASSQGALSSPLPPLQDGVRRSSAKNADRKPRFTPVNRSIVAKDRLFRLVRDEAFFNHAILKFNDLLGHCQNGVPAKASDASGMRRVVSERDVQINFYSFVEGPVLLALKQPSPELKEKLQVEGGESGEGNVDVVWTFEGKPFMNVEFRMEQHLGESVWTAFGELADSQKPFSWPSPGQTTDAAYDLIGQIYTRMLQLGTSASVLTTYTRTVLVSRDGPILRCSRIYRFDEVLPYTTTRVVAATALAALRGDSASSGIPITFGERSTVQGMPTPADDEIAPVDAKDPSTFKTVFPNVAPLPAADRETLSKVGELVMRWSTTLHDIGPCTLQRVADESLDDEDDEEDGTPKAKRTKLPATNDADAMTLDQAAGPSNTSASTPSAAYLIVDTHLDFTSIGLFGSGVINPSLPVLVSLSDGNYRLEDLQHEADCRQLLADAGLESAVARCFGVFQGEEYTVLIEERPDKAVEKWSDLGPDQWLEVVSIVRRMAVARLYLEDLRPDMFCADDITGRVRLTQASSLVHFGDGQDAEREAMQWLAEASGRSV